MMYFVTILTSFQLFLGTSQDIPYRDEATYKLSLKMEFKVETPPNSSKVEYTRQPKYSAEPQMYLNASLKLLTLLKDDYKIKVHNNKGQLIVSKKLKSIDTFLIKLGFANHIKEKKAANIFTIQFINKEKNVASQIILEIKENGDFIVNDKPFGKV